VDASTAAAVVSATIAILALGFGLIQYSERRRQQLLADLQGDKEAVAAAATRVRHGKLPRRKRNRRELLEALCLATVFERSGRSRSLLYAALAKAMATEQYRTQIINSVEGISIVISRNSPYTDLARARRRLFALRAALGVDGDLRMRVERLDISPSQVDDTATPDERCTDETHRWGALREVLRQLQSIVLVCPTAGPGHDGRGDCATIALDFHRAAQLPKRHVSETPVDRAARDLPHQLPIHSGERFRLTDVGNRLVRAKYRGSVADLSPIATQLASVITNHPAYARAAVIVTVPGTSHDFSARLGEEVARRASRLCVLLTRRRSNAGPEFVLDSNLVKDRDVILLDDVYRTGDTLRDAAQVLRKAGAHQVLGLTATCTVSAIAPHCDN
jgi:Phosphoribosyl transferase domain